MGLLSHHLAVGVDEGFVAPSWAWLPEAVPCLLAPLMCRTSRSGATCDPSIRLPEGSISASAKARWNYGHGLARGEADSVQKVSDGVEVVLLHPCRKWTVLLCGVCGRMALTALSVWCC